MTQPVSSPAVHAPAAPAARLTWQGAGALALGLTSAFLFVITGFTFAVTLIWPG